MPILLLPFPQKEIKKSLMNIDNLEEEEIVLN